MVLLTSSAVSAVISVSIVCIFTFLLFLSGYVLQQQTVRSLQEALRHPPEKPWFPTPVLPPQFREDADSIGLSSIENDTFRPLRSRKGRLLDDEQQLLGLDETLSLGQKQPKLREPSPQQLWRDYVTSGTSKEEMVEQFGEDDEEDSTFVATSEDEVTSNARSQNRLAYILTAPNLSDVCSVALFVKWYRSISRLSTSPGIVLIYPATWEMSDSPTHVDAMDMIRDMQEQSDVICHPVSISRIWAGVSVESQLLAELQRTRWSYDRAMYLRSPGMALDVAMLDKSLASSNIKKSWQGLSSKSTSLQPSLLLYAREKGLLAPKSETRRLTAQATAMDESHSGDDIALESKNAAYIIFADKDLDHHRYETVAYNGIFERFERERRNMCAGTTLLGESYDIDRKK